MGQSFFFIRISPQCWASDCAVVLVFTVSHSVYLCLYSRVMTYREHGAWVVKAHLQKETDGNIISVRYTLHCTHMHYVTLFATPQPLPYLL